MAVEHDSFYEPLDPSHETFNPRMAALHHAALIEDDTQRNHATAIACALIYVGDQLGNVCSHLEQLDVTVHNQLHEIAEAM